MHIDIKYSRDARFQPSYTHDQDSLRVWLTNLIKGTMVVIVK